MSGCPNTEELIQLLDSLLDAVAGSRVETHVENCSRCQCRLDELTRGDGPLLGGNSGQGHSWGCPATGPEDPGFANPHATTDIDPDLTSDGSDGQTDRDADPPIADLAMDDFESTPSTPFSPYLLSDSSPKKRRNDCPTVPGYTILGKLGEGGMGTVYKARHERLNRVVALKMIRGGGHARSDQLARLRIEAEAVARLQHPNIIQVFDTGEVGGTPFLSLELLEGGGLDKRLAGNPQSSRTAAELMVTLALAVHKAHEAGIVHRDLKPTNVLFTADGVPKITDFGLAKRVDSENFNTLSGQIMGTPSYMAPEQARGNTKSVGPPADVYSLGSILYEMLTGRAPFKGETPIETARQVIDLDPVTPSRLVPRIERDLETICLKCLSKDPHKRYASARNLADDLVRYLEGRPIRARRTPLWERGLKWIKRHPAVTTMSALAASVVLGLLFAAWYYDRYSREKKHSKEMEIATARTKADVEIIQAQDALARNDLNGARTRLLELRPRIENESQLRVQHERAGILLAQIQRRVDDQLTRDAGRARFEEFRSKRDETLVQETHFTGLGPLSNQGEARKSAQAALSLFAAPGAGGRWALGPLPLGLLPSQKTEVTNGCYELLLVLAETASQPREGLELLDRAGTLHPPTQAYHRYRASCLARLGDTVRAQEERLLADRLPPVTPFDHFLSGQELYRRQEWIGAIRHFETALQLEPDHFWAHCLSAICCLNVKLYAQAKTNLNACLQRKPDLAWLYVLRGFTSNQIAALAEEAIEKLQSKGATLRTEAELQFEAAEADYRKALNLLQQSPNDELRYALLVNRGLLRSQRRQWDAAVADLQAAIQLDGRRYQAFAELALAYQRRGKPDLAIAQFDRAIALAPGQAALYRGRAAVNIERSDSSSALRERALSDLEQAIRLEKPDNTVQAVDHTNRARLLHAAGREEKALEACEAAIRIADYAEAHRLRLAVLQALRRYDDIMRSCNALLAKGNPSAELFELRALAREHTEDYLGAIDDDTQAIALRPQWVPLRVRRGWLYTVSNAPRLALRDFEEAIRLEPSNSDAFIGRGSARVRLGQYRGAVDDAARAISLGEPSPETLYKASRIYAQAAIAATTEVRRTGQEAISLVSRYQDNAVALVREALKRLPPGQRASFASNVVSKDPAFLMLRRRLRSLELTGHVTANTR
jgi:serine/threonine protein kinase/lipoprotein NlpI